MQIQSGHISQSGIFRSKMNFWNAPNGSNLCVIFTVILQKIIVYDFELNGTYYLFNGHRTCTTNNINVAIC